jgi:hypothetical protein
MRKRDQHPSEKQMRGQAVKLSEERRRRIQDELDKGQRNESARPQEWHDTAKEVIRKHHEGKK